MKLYRLLAVAAAATTLGGSPAASATAPAVSVGSINSLSIPPAPYDERADANAVVDAAFARARETHKLVLIDLGGNWCADCLILSAVIDLPEMRGFLNRHYEIVYVDVGRFNRNLQIPARFGIVARLEGAPAVLVATPDGHLLNRDHIAALVDARTMTPQAIADWLASWAR